MLRAELTVPEMFRCTIRSLSGVVPRAISWIWRGWVPRGSLSLVLGEPGVGKSLYALQLAAMVTRGWQTLPAAENETCLSVDQACSASVPVTSGSEMPVPGKSGTVVLFEPGDGATILRSRLEAAGADFEKIVLVERNWRNDSTEEVEEFLQSEPHEPVKCPSRVDKDRELRRDLESLEQHVVQLRQSGHDVSLVIIDPIETLLRDSIDKYRLAQLLGELADRLNVAIVAVGTTSSTPRAYPGLRLDGKGIDSLFKASKAVVTVTLDPEDTLQRLVQPTKLNLSAAPPGLTFAFQGDGRLEWGQTMVSLTEQQHEVQTPPPRKGSIPRDVCPEALDKELNRAIQWLKARLSDGGVPVSEVRSGARQYAIGKATLQRAYDQLSCVSKKCHGLNGRVWQLPVSVDAKELDVDDHGQSKSSSLGQRVNGISPTGVCR